MTIKVLTMVNQFKRKMALILIFMAMIRPCFSNHREEMALANVTRFASGDLFSLVGPECGLTRCMEVSHGTALAAMGVSGCSCQCARDTPAFREDQKICVNHIDECRMASYGRGATKPQIPFVFLPLKGQIVYPAKEIVFTDVEDAVCAVTSAQYLSPSGWLALRDLVDNDVPFALYRDEGSTYLQWRGSSALHGRLEGRLVTVHVLCSAPAPARLAASCASFRVAGATHNTILDVRSIPFHAGEIVNTEQVSQSKGLSVLEYLAIGVCVLMVIFIYAAGIIFYIHYKQKQKRKAIDPELNRSRTASTENISTIDMDNVRLKKNPLLNLDNMNDFLNDAGLSDVSERTEDTLDSSTNFQKQFQNPNIVSAMIHTHRKKPSRPSLRTSTPERLTERLQRRSASPEIEKAPQSDLSIIDCSVETNSMTSLNPPTNVEPVIRRKLYFNPVFFEVEHLKNPPPAAIDFLIKIREIMAIAKEKMLSKRFIPMLSDIPEEDLYHTLDLGWNIPCARRGRRFSAISLKRENSRRAVHCGGCPGCDSSDSKSQKAPGLIRSNSCKTCVSDDYKQRIVQKWLDEVPSPPQTIRPTKSIAKVSGTPRIVDTKKKDDVRVSPVIPIRRDESHANKQEVRKPIESGSREKLSNLRVKETIDVKRDLDKPKTIISNQDNNRNEKKLTSPPSNKKPQEKRSPSSNATRRVVRKKLPPPPPPPVNPQEPVTPDKKEPVLPEVKVKMEAVIKELNKCKRSEEGELEELRRLAVLASGPKIVIPVVSADSQYYSDDNTLTHDRKATHLSEISMEFDSLERNILKRRRFSLDFGSEIIQKQQTIHKFSELPMERLSRSWRDIKKAVEATPSEQIKSIVPNISTCRVNDLYMNPIEPLYNNIETPGPLTIEVRGSPVDIRQKIHDDFDPDTLDRKPRREMKKSVEKILLKSGGSFKNKIVSHNANYDFAKEGERKTPPEAVFTRKIGSLRQIYEAKAKAQQEPRLYERRSSLPYANHDIAKFMKSVRPSDFRKAEGQSDPKPPIPPKQRRGSEKYSPPSERQRSEEKERVTQYIRSENLNVRRSGRRSSRTRSRRVDLKKLCRTEDSGYLSTDSNESKCRARYMMLRPKFLPPEPAPKPVPPVVRTLAIQIESDTDEMESLCDGRSESGGESVETDSVFFGNFDESKEMYSELGLCVETRDMLAASQDQIDSGFVGETNIILSGDSDSEHRSVISIVTGRDGRSSVASITKLDDTPYVHSVEC
ncbi:PREDICTED: uncharacterized protein LOC106114532 isoform X1 [Papilio xuthus]|uniref:Uncharacterized protein LOC106114532 isoform X1 n=1 Tax=Papilio xuthus TaxID=66420 RepID=A0AAJ6Z1I2_PAPXU|nr:PREDICTED: uncharacterized protein LOC106114532 isoform X1 [Papilio xuthus]